jgi:hypothetical protein
MKERNPESVAPNAVVTIDEFDPRVGQMVQGHFNVFNLIRDVVKSLAPLRHESPDRAIRIGGLDQFD